MREAVLVFSLSPWERVGVRGLTEQKPRLFADTLTHVRGMRRRPTEAESKLWSYLRKRRLAGAKFRRQHPVGPFIVDFYCAEAKLVVELDGGGHAASAQSGQDRLRSQELERLGVRVLRFWNGDVFQNVEGVLDTIGGALVLTDGRKKGEGC